jgi:tRNA pseudouridine55 synthase
MDGFINLLKPVGPTSSQVVNRVRRLTGNKKVGHTGTLDPGASGVLPICLGKATKLSALITNSGKVYSAEITFGVTTDTQDKYGKVLKECRANIKKERIEELLQEFKGPQRQIPPMYSAIKQGGVKLYELARKGIEVERKARDIEIYRLELADYFPPDRAVIEIECSKGTYIRTLCHDIGIMSGYGAIMSSLTRLSAGEFRLDNAVTLVELENAKSQGKLDRMMLPIDYPLKHMPKVFVKDSSLKYALNGNRLYAHNLATNSVDYNHGQQLRLYNGHTLLGIYSYNCDTQPPCFRIQMLLTDADAQSVKKP